MGVAEHPYYLDISRCHDTNWFAGQPHCPNGPALIDWFNSTGKNVPETPYTFQLRSNTTAQQELISDISSYISNFNNNVAKKVGRVPLEHTYDEVLMDPASKFLSTHELFDTLMQNPQEGLKFDFTKQHSDRAVQKVVLLESRIHKPLIIKFRTIINQNEREIKITNFLLIWTTLQIQMEICRMEKLI